MSSSQRKRLNGLPVIPESITGIDGSDESSEDDNKTDAFAAIANANAKIKKSKRKGKKKSTVAEVKKHVVVVPQQKSKKKTKEKKKNAKDEDIDELLKEFEKKDVKNGKTTTNQTKNTSERKKEKGIFSIEVSKLNPEVELRKLFGKAVANSMTKKKNSTKMIFSRKDPHWPEPRGALILKKLGVQADGAIAYGFEMSDVYVKAEKEFVACVATNQPDTLVLLLQRYGFHAGALLQLATLSQKTGQFEQAYDLLERAIFFYERCIGTTIHFEDPFVRIPFAHKENQGIHVVLFRWIAMQGRKGCTRTALECCKVMLNWDGSDPLDVLLMIDLFALRSAEYEWLVELYKSGFATKNLSLYPNLAYGVAFSMFHMKEKYGMDQAQFHLVAALRKFPECIEKILTELAVAGTWKKSYLLQCSRNAPPSGLDTAMKIFCQRSRDMFRAKALQEWICDVLSQEELFIDCHKDRDEVIQAYESENEMYLPFLGRHMVLMEEDLEGGGGAIPVGLLQEALDLDQLDAPPPPHSDIAMARLMGSDARMPSLEDQVQSLQHAPTENALALFLHSLLPWNAPNAPPIEEREGWIEAMRGIIGLQEGGANSNIVEREEYIEEDEDNPESSHTEED